MKATDTITIAFPYNRSIKGYDPLRIQLAPEYALLDNIYSPLVEFDITGELVSSVASRFFWSGTEAHFEIRPDLKTVDGHPITAMDAAISLKRIIIRNSNTHGNLKSLLCPDAQVNSLNDDCPGLLVSEDHKSLILKFTEKKPFLFSMLAAIDFAIIPRGSIDSNTLDIVDYRNTSGPYFVKNEDGKGNIHLEANPLHFHYNSKMPHNCKLVPVGVSDPLESIDLYRLGKIDVITSVDRAPHHEVLALSTELGAEPHSTLPLRTHMVTFSKKGRTNLSEQSRFLISSLIKKAFLAEITGKPGYQATEQLFPTVSEAALTEDEVKQVRSKLTFSDIQNRYEEPLIVWLVKMHSISPDSPTLKAYFPKASFIPMDKVPSFTDFSKSPHLEPDLILSGADMGFQEDIGLLSFYLAAEYFLPLGKAGDLWIEKYINIESKDARLKMMRKLHFDTLMSAVSIPIATSPYVVLARRPLIFELSKTRASDSLWRARFTH